MCSQSTGEVRGGESTQARGEPVKHGMYAPAYSEGGAGLHGRYKKPLGRTQSMRAS